MSNNINEVWVFNGENSRFSSGIFSNKKNAEEWIKKHNLSGVLTLYFVDIPPYEWAIENNFFIPKTEKEKTSEFIQKFTSGSQEHNHYELGKEN